MQFKETLRKSSSMVCTLMKYRALINHELVFTVFLCIRESLSEKLAQGSQNSVPRLILANVSLWDFFSLINLSSFTSHGAWRGRMSDKRCRLSFSLLLYWLSVVPSLANLSLLRAIVLPPEVWEFIWCQGQLAKRHATVIN